MKTLVLFGSARRNGHTAQMLNLFLEHLGGEYEIIDTYRVKNISPCMDCRYCWKVKGCAIQDGMQEIYRKLEEADNLILASPVYFHSVTGPMKVLIDRFQIYWAGLVRKDKPEGFIRKGAVLMTGGAPPFPDQFLGCEIVLKNLLRDLNTECLGTVCFPNTDKDTLDGREDIRQEIISLADKMRSSRDLGVHF